MGALLLIGALFGLFGLAVVISGVVAAVKQARTSRRGERATGTVVEVVKRVFTRGSAGVYCPVVAFFTPTGQIVRFQSDFGTMPASHRVGQPVAVRYDPADPQKAALDSATANWLVPGITIAMGLVFLVMGLVFVVMGIVVLAGQR